MKNERQEKAEVAFDAHWQAGTDEQSDNRNDARRKAVQATQSDDNMLCACTGLMCEGICRELHLHRPRFANPTAKKDAAVNTSWTTKCPESYHKN